MICPDCGTSYEPVDYPSVYPWPGACRCTATARYAMSRDLAKRPPGRRVGAQAYDERWFQEHAEALKALLGISTPEPAAQAVVLARKLAPKAQSRTRAVKLDS